MCLHLLGITIIRYRYENWKSYLYYIIDDYGYTQLRSPVPSTPSIMACRDTCSSNRSYAVGVLVVSYSSYQQPHSLSHLLRFYKFSCATCVCPRFRVLISTISTFRGSGTLKSHSSEFRHFYTIEDRDVGGHNSKLHRQRSPCL